MYIYTDNPDCLRETNNYGVIECSREQARPRCRYTDNPDCLRETNNYGVIECSREQARPRCIYILTTLTV